MKGVIADFITTVLDRTGVNKIMGYLNRYELDDLEDDDFITKYLLVNSQPPSPPTPTTIQAGVTVNPLIVIFVGNASTLYSLRRAADSSYDWNTSVIFDGSQFTITGDDDGTGHFADGFTFAIKP